jgi:hypothetical protein
MVHTSYVVPNSGSASQCVLEIHYLRYDTMTATERIGCGYMQEIRAKVQSDLASRGQE